MHEQPFFLKHIKKKRIIDKEAQTLSDYLCLLPSLPPFFKKLEYNQITKIWWFNMGNGTDENNNKKISLGEHC